MGEISEEHVERCHLKFENRFMQAEAQAAAKGVVCPSHGGLLPFQKTVQQATVLIQLSSSAKTLTVEIASEDLASLQAAGQKLNIAIIVDGTFNVVWQSISNYGESNIYQWSPIFRVFADTTFEDGAIINSDIISVGAVNVALGSEVTFQADGTIDVLEPVSGGSTNSISFNNGSTITLHPGLVQQLTVTPSTTPQPDMLPIYAIPFLFFPEETEVLTPGDEVMVWFEDTVTGTIFLVTPSNSIVADLTATNTATVRFSNGEWTIPDGS